MPRKGDSVIGGGWVELDSTPPATNACVWTQQYRGTSRVAKGCVCVGITRDSDGRAHVEWFQSTKDQTVRWDGEKFSEEEDEPAPPVSVLRGGFVPVYGCKPTKEVS